MNKDNNDSNLLLTSLFTCSAIIILNFTIGIFTPTTVSMNDEIGFFDTLWRVTAGQHVGTDYHDPLGFGPFEVGAQFWLFFGAHHYLFRLSIALFSMSIAICGCLVAKRMLAHRAHLALLFCVTLAFQLSAPTVYPDSVQFGLMEFYNRLSASTLAVLFLQALGGLSVFGVAKDRHEIAVSVTLSAILLNLLFLTKISGFLLGVVIAGVGCASQRRFVFGFLVLCATLTIFGAITAVEFKLTGLDVIAVMREYEMAARARSAHSVYDIVRSAANWPLVVSVVLLVAFVAPQRRNRQGRQSGGFRDFSIVIGCYAACQLALNMTNAGPPTMWLAPAAMASLASRMGSEAIIPQGRPFENLIPDVRPDYSRRFSLREASLVLVFALVLVRQVLGSILGIGFGAATALGITEPYVITAGKALNLWVYPAGEYEKSLNDAVQALTSLELGQEKIANLDYSNPFSALFLAPPPNGNYVWFGWGYNIPADAALNWHDVIGDACVVMIPMKPFYPEVTRRLMDITRSKLSSDFKVVFQDKSWSIYQRVNGCRIAPR